jgi:hypothetical protein
MDLAKIVISFAEHPNTFESTGYGQWSPTTFKFESALVQAGSELNFSVVSHSPRTREKREEETTKQQRATRHHAW